MINADELDRRVRIEKRQRKKAISGAGSGDWVFVAEVWASVRDVLPNRGERLEGGINLATRPARVRMRYRTDVTGDMRLVIGPDRIAQIITTPAEIGRREGIEFIVEDFSSAGGGA